MSGLRMRLDEKAYNAKKAFSSWQAFKSWVQLPDTALDQHGHSKGGPTWSNEDLDPTPYEKRTWRWWNFVIFYWGLSFGNWTLGATMIGIGLNWWQAILTIFISQTVSSIAMFFNSRCASVYHIGYPVVGRSVFGMWGAYYFVLARAALAVIWYGVQLYSGSALLANMLRAAFGHNYTDIPNTIPQSIGNVGVGHLKSATTANNGWGWFFISSINAGMGNTATLITNQPDIARWSKTKSGAMWSQLFSNPIAVTLSASLGILSTSALNNAWGLALWNQWDLLDAILDRFWSPGARTAVFLAAMCWSVSILGTNVAANMIPFGADSSMLLPRLISIPRGQFLVECLAFAICPWTILASAGTFTTFLAGYGLFMASVVAIMVCDYWVLTRGNVFISHLYDGSRDNKHYYYHKGWNLQAVIAYLCGIALPFAGFVGTLGPKVSDAATKLGQLGWLLSFAVSFVVYWLLCLVWPTANQKIVRQLDLGWEEMSYQQLVAVDGTVIRDEQEGYPDEAFEEKTAHTTIGETGSSRLS
nr:allantoin permease [Quercus suber]